MMNIFHVCTTRDDSQVWYLGIMHAYCIYIHWGGIIMTSMHEAHLRGMDCLPLHASQGSNGERRGTRLVTSPENGLVAAERCQRLNCHAKEAYMLLL